MKYSVLTVIVGICVAFVADAHASQPATAPIGRGPAVMGIVTDAETGEMVQRFRVVPGRDDGGAGRMFFHQHAQEFHGGHYIYARDILSYPPVIRIEADGYLPVVSGVLDPQKDNEFDVALRKAPNLEYTVLAPDGEPARGADVLIATASTQAMLRNERPDRHQNYAPRTTTDENGRLVVWPVGEDFRLLVLHDAGYFEATSKELALMAKTIALEPWGRIEGTLMIGGKPGANDHVTYHTPDPLPEEGSRFHRMNEVPTDGLGRFLIDRVPPGSVTVGRYVQIYASERGAAWGTSDPKLFDVKPGEMLRVTLGGTGRPVVGRFLIPQDLADGWRVYVQFSSVLARASIPIPDDVRARGDDAIRRWRDEFLNSNAGKEWLADDQRQRAAQRHYCPTVARDGSFRIEDVAPGVYQLDARFEAVVEDGGGAMRVEQLGRAQAEVVVSDIPGGRTDEVLNAGAILVTGKD